MMGTGTWLKNYAPLLKPREVHKEKELGCSNSGGKSINNKAVKEAEKGTLSFLNMESHNFGL